MDRNWRKNSLTWGKRLVLVLMIMAGLFYGVITMAQRSPESLRKGLEDYLAQSTGQVGEITEMREARLFPVVLFDMQGINIRDAEDRSKIYAHADSARIATPFWRILTGSTGFIALEIKGLEIATGYLLPQKLVVEFAGITDPDPAADPYLLVQGRYNDRPLMATMEMLRKTGRRGIVYMLADTSLTTFKLGETEGEGVIRRHFSSVSLESARLQSGGMTAEFTVRNLDKRPLAMTMAGTVEGVPFNAVLTDTGENISFKIKPEGNDPAALDKIKRFTDSLMGDMGVSATDTALRIEIDGQPAQTATQSPPEE